MHNHWTYRKEASFIGGFFISLILMLGLASCGSKATRTESVFRYNEPSGIASLDPAFASDKSSLWVVQQLYDGLVRLDSANQIQPALAKNWSISSDGTSYTFCLREAYFHSGKKVSAQDVVASLYRLRDPKVASPGAWVLEDVDTIRVVHPDSLEIHLHAPNSAFLSKLTMAYCSIVDPKAAQEGTLATSAGGTGPFKFHVWHFGEKLILHRNEKYWQRDGKGNALPYLDGISVQFLPDQQSAFLEYLRGNFDFLPNLDPSFKDDLLQKDGTLNPKYAAAHRLERSPFLNTEYLAFNASSELPFELRWAINAGVDRARMIQELRNGVGIPADGGMVPFGLPEYQKGIGISYQPDSVLALLRSYPELPELTLVTVSNYRDLCEYVQGELSKLGWQIGVNVVPSATLRSEKSAGTLDFFRASWIADYPDAENYLMLFYGPYSAPNGPNYSRLDDPTYNSLFESIVDLPVGVERQKAIRDADAYLMEQAFCMPLYYDEVLRVFPGTTSGVETNALNSLILLRAQVK
jgi:peptide/nickel transport system substrate-binding protein